MPDFGHRSELFLFSLVLCCTATLAVPDSCADVLTYHNDNQRTGLYPSETGLNTTSVRALTQKWSFKVDGQVYAQPLYVSSVFINGVRHNELIIATELDSVYALDAITGTQLWKTSLIPMGERQVAATCNDLTPFNGITGTPVIDRAKGKVFVVAYTQNLITGHKLYRLHALDLHTGQDTASPEMAATFVGSFPAVDVMGGQVHWNAAQERQRAALLLVSGTIYVAFASFCDSAPFAGWIFAFDETTLAQVGRIDLDPTAAGLAVRATLPDGSGGSVWGAGAGMAATPDSSFIFAASGNGPFDGKTTFGDSILKLAPRSLQVLDFFTPFNQVADQQGDQDVGSGGVVLLPAMIDAKGVSRTLGVIAGKDKKTYLFDQSNLGKITANNSALYQPIGPAFANPIFGPSAFFNGALYFGPRDGAIVKFVFSQAKLSTSPAVRTSDLFAAQGTVPAVSAFVNSAGMASNGIVWSIGLAPLTTGGGATLHAYDATNLATLFTSTPLATGGTKFSVPTISNSMVYLGTIGAVYGFAGIATPSNSASNVTTASGVKITTGPITRDPATGLFLQTVTVKNAGITALFKTPLSFVLDKLGTNAELLNGSGATTYLAPLASPYLNFALAAPLAPGASVSLNLQFLNSSGGAITYTARLLDGLGYR